MGDVDMVRTLALARVPCAFFGPSDASARFSRQVQVVLPWFDHWRHPEEIVAALLDFARTQSEPPVLYPQTDADLLVVSRHRDRLAHAFRFALADAELVEQLVDKARFQALAERHSLPVPPAQRLRLRPSDAPPALEVPFPVIAKPVMRGGDWTATGELGKALHVRGPEEWAAVWPRLAELRCELLIQRLVPGPETAVESYHAYVDADGAIAGEFTGRKIRTYPVRYGYSTAVEITRCPDVARLGRDVLARLGLRGVAKADFKRDEDGRLHLLEINPRFNLWHHPAAVAGVNLPALVHADLSGRPRPAARPEIRNVRWCMPLTDLKAAHATGMSVLAWARWARGCDAVSGLSRDDPLPFVRGKLWPAARSRLPRPVKRRTAGAVRGA